MGGCYIHGHGGEVLYKCWQAFISRCTNSDNPQYFNYGARGITVCLEWQESYDNFKAWAKNAGHKPGLSLDRIDNNLGYAPDNCRWATAKEQQNNTRKNRLISINGERKTIAAWCEDPRCGVAANTVYSRLYRGWKPEEAVFTKQKY